MSECLWAGGSGRVGQKMVPSILLLSCELSVSVKENPDKKKVWDHVVWSHQHLKRKVFTVQKMKFSIKDFFSTKSMENFIFCAVVIGPLQVTYLLTNLMNAVYSQLEIARRINLLIFKQINRINLLTFRLANFVLYFEFLFSKFWYFQRYFLL